MRDFARLLDQTAASMSGPLLVLIRGDLENWRSWAREHGDYAAVCMIDVMIQHANAEIARRDDTKGPHP